MTRCGPFQVLYSPARSSASPGRGCGVLVGLREAQLWFQRVSRCASPDPSSGSFLKEKPGEVGEGDRCQTWISAGFQLASLAEASPLSRSAPSPSYPTAHPPLQSWPSVWDDAEPRIGQALKKCELEDCMNQRMQAGGKEEWKECWLCLREQKKVGPKTQARCQENPVLPKFICSLELLLGWVKFLPSPASLQWVGQVHSGPSPLQSTPSCSPFRCSPRNPYPASLLCRSALGPLLCVLTATA